MFTVHSEKPWSNQVGSISESMEFMHILFERSGGFMGMTTKTSFDLSDIPEAEAEQVRAIIEKVDFSKLPEKSQNINNSADQFTYTITITSQEWEQTIITSDASAPEDIQPLIKSLNEISRSRRGK
jgi:hypothetical protein